MARLGVVYRIMIEFILSLSKGLDLEFVIGERIVVNCKSVMGFKREGENKIFLKFFPFLLDRTNIGCPHSYEGTPRRKSEK